MATKTKTKTKTPKTSEAPKAAPPSPRRGRPPGRKKITVGFSLDPDVAEYAKDLGSAKVNTILRRSMERRGTR
jgi:uncharacterized protein (DUF4415 family)